MLLVVCYIAIDGASCDWAYERLLAGRVIMLKSQICRPFDAKKGKNSTATCLSASATQIDGWDQRAPPAIIDICLSAFRDIVAC